MDPQLRIAGAHPPPVCQPVLGRHFPAVGLAILPVADDEWDRIGRVHLLDAAEPMVATVKGRHREGNRPPLVAVSQLVGQLFF